MPSTIPTGPFFGFTLAELEAVLVQYKAAVAGAAIGGGQLISANVNGNGLQFATRELTLAEQGAELQAALYYLRPDKYAAPPTNASAVRFAGGGSCC